jgi:hypothetical protein
MVGSWTKRIKEEIEGLHLVFIWQRQENNNNNNNNNNERCNYIESQNLFSLLSENMLLVFYHDVIYILFGEEYTTFCRGMREQYA